MIDSILSRQVVTPQKVVLVLHLELQNSEVLAPLLLENLKREVKEETGLEITSEPRLLAAQDIIPNPEKHVVRLSYVADTEEEPVLDTDENTEYRWLSIVEIKQQDNLDKYTKDVLARDLIK